MPKLCPDRRKVGFCQSNVALLGPHATAAVEGNQKASNRMLRAEPHRVRGDKSSSGFQDLARRCTKGRCLRIVQMMKDADSDCDIEGVFIATGEVACAALQEST